MKIPHIALFSTAFACILASALGSPELKPIPDLIPTADYPADKVKEIQSIAFHKWPMLAEETPKVAGAFKTIRPIKGFSDRDDLIWEVRIIHLVQTPTGILWINDRTKESIVIGSSE